MIDIIDNREFAEIYNSSINCEEVSNRTGMSLSEVYNKARRVRKKGHRLKSLHFKDKYREYHDLSDYDLIRLCRQGDQRAWAYARNSRFVKTLNSHRWKMSKQFMTTKHDTYSAVDEGLVMAIHHFKSDRGAKFESYLSKILKHIGMQGCGSVKDGTAYHRRGAIRVPFRVNRFRYVSTDEVELEDEQERTLFDFVDRDDIKRILQETLNDREYVVVCLTFGLHGVSEKWSGSKVAKLIGTSKQRVHQIVNRSIEKIREWISNDIWLSEEFDLQKT